MDLSFIGIDTRVSALINTRNVGMPETRVLDNPFESSLNIICIYTIEWRFV